MNNQAFIDGQNLRISTMNAEPSWIVDLKRFRIFLTEKYHVKEAYYFIGAFSPKNQDLYDQEDFDKIILVSGDGDYWRMVDYLIKKDRFGKLLVPNKQALSYLYKSRTPDTYRAYLDDPATKKKINLEK